MHSRWGNDVGGDFDRTYLEIPSLRLQTASSLVHSFVQLDCAFNQWALEITKLVTRLAFTAPLACLCEAETQTEIMVGINLKFLHVQQYPPGLVAQQFWQP